MAGVKAMGMIMLFALGVVAAWFGVNSMIMAIEIIVGQNMTNLD